MLPQSILTIIPWGQAAGSWSEQTGVGLDELNGLLGDSMHMVYITFHR